MSNALPLPELTPQESQALQLEIRAMESGLTPLAQAWAEVQQRHEAEPAEPTPPEPTVLERLGQITSSAFGFPIFPNTRGF